MILVIDNYDSFTFNLVQFLAELGAKVVVRRNDALGVEEVMALRPEGILLSPGPGRPEGAGITPLCVARLGQQLPMLGVCLGHQAIGEAFGARLVHAKRLMHGRTSLIQHEGRNLFQGLPSPFTATRYHSLTLDPSTIPSALHVTATSDDGEVMALRHRDLPVWGVQFHPESFLTEHGHALLRNFLSKLPHHGAQATSASDAICGASMSGGPC